MSKPDLEKMLNEIDDVLLTADKENARAIEALKALSDTVDIIEVVNEKSERITALEAALAAKEQENAELRAEVTSLEGFSSAEFERANFMVKVAEGWQLRAEALATALEEVGAEDDPKTRRRLISAALDAYRATD